MIKIYGSPNSSAGRCYWCLEEIGLKYEVIPLDMRAKQHKSPEFLKLNPNGKIPVLIDGDLTIWESMAINFYLGDRYKQQLIGSSVKDRAYIRQWSFWAITELQPPLVEILIQNVFTPQEFRDPAIVARAEKKYPQFLSVLNDSLQNKSFLVANDFTMADLNVASVINIYQSLGHNLSSYKNIESWYNRVTDRPSFHRLQERIKSRV